MSALPPKPDFRRRECEVRFVPKAEVVAIRSVELIVQPGTKDAVGEMGVRGNWPCGRSRGFPATTKTGKATRTCGIERAKVHVKALDFPSPVARHKWQVPLRAV